MLIEYDLNNFGLIPRRHANEWLLQQGKGCGVSSCRNYLMAQESMRFSALLVTLVSVFRVYFGA